MKYQTLDEMADAHDVATARIVRWWKEGKEINGRRIKSDEIDGERRFWLEGEGDQEPEEEACPESYGEITCEWLRGVRGIGQKAAEGVIRGCMELEVSTLVGLHSLEDLTQFDGVGNGNGANLREALQKEICDTDPSEPTAPDRTATDGEVVTAEFDLGDGEPDPDYEINLPEFPMPEDSDTLAFDDTEAAEEEDAPDDTEAEREEEAPAAVCSTYPHGRDHLPIPDRVHPALPECTLFAKTKVHSDDWHKARAAGIGSSDAGAVLGLSPHAGPKEIFASKTGGEVEDMPWLEPYAWFGTWFEPYLLELLEYEHGIELIAGDDIGTLQSIHWDRALANVDALDITTGAVEEYKTSEEKWITVPPCHEAQCQHQMFVTGAEEVRLRQFVCPIDRRLVPSLVDRFRKIAFVDQDGDDAAADWLIEHGEIHTWIIERDESYIERLIEAERKFWDFVDMGITPPDRDPEGTVDLSNNPDVVSCIEKYARLATAYERHVQKFADAKGIDTDGRGSAKGKVKKALKAIKKEARAAIKRAVALSGENCKRVSVGDHSATLVEKEAYSYWNLYAGEAEDVFGS